MIQATISMILTDEELGRAIALYTAGTPNFAKRLCEEMIEPNIGRINAAIGQENDPMYLAYVVENLLNKAQRYTE